MADLIVPHGYPLEEHFVTTGDGYILRLFRVPHGRHPRAAEGDGGAAGGGGGGGGGSSGRGLLSGGRGWAKADAEAAAGSGGEALAAQGGGGRRGGRTAEQQQQQEEEEEEKQRPGGGGGGGARRPVVHLQHGLLGAGSDWALNGPGLSLAFVLADAGYDVWMGNVRANSYSRNHTHLEPADPAFWAFTWDDIALKDLPAMLKRELEVTGADSLAYVGHSQGTTVALALLSARPEWARRVHLAVLLAPVAVVTHVASPPLVALAKLNTDEIFTLLGISEFLPSSEALSRLDGQLCKLEPHLCVNLIAMICGYSLQNVDASRLPVYLNYTPSGTSVANMAHWSQAMRLADPAAMPYFDYGTRCSTILGAPRACNQRMYGQLEPPRYNLSRIDTPLALFTGGQDRLADPADAALLASALPRRWLASLRHQPAYAHLDYLWGVNARRVVYGEVLALLGEGPALRAHMAAAAAAAAAEDTPAAPAAAAAEAAAAENTPAAAAAAVAAAAAAEDTPAAPAAAVAAAAAAEDTPAAPAAAVAAAAAAEDTPAAAAAAAVAAAAARRAPEGGAGGKAGAA
ncbi:lysosomal acid lipase cholesteryl ester hydrolase-like [Raphidocelis subcapitata]|uniref:Lysosomal acid lipase cholesteryl ester hydrolase-like n=1 Tax=Raphidocelis subcapitata TaxID=307507 RepID=A0A2V0PI09_9CHLO|nr:lysosomal acid lipase cholesteryl ester hydrolase-like [Raphidocelis subcapitata]|eukprot:GBF96705.1 lysosomal acid lipase cholesteryl ester hydrolase-like [Raphidocelis subcapitata]